MSHIAIVESLTPKEYLKVRANKWDSFRNKRPRLLTIHGIRLRVLNMETLGAYYHRGPKVLTYLFGESPNSQKTGKA